MRGSRSLPLVLVWGLAAACTGPSIADDAAVVTPDGGPVADAAPPVGDAPVDAGSDTPSDAGPPPSAAFVELYDTVLAPHCSGENCHAPGPPNESTYFEGRHPTLEWLDAASARAVLVDRPFECAWSPDDRVRVVPFHPEESGVMEVGIDGICGSRHYLVLAGFGAMELAAIESWIADGAL